MTRLVCTTMLALGVAMAGTSLQAQQMTETSAGHGQRHGAVHDRMTFVPFAPRVR